MSNMLPPRTRLGLDASLPVQYIQFLDSVIQLRLGDLIFLGRSVMQALAERAPLTLQLTALAAGLATLIGVPIGVPSAVKRGSLVDHAVMAASMAGASLPSFWIGLTLIEYLAVRLHVLPVAGYGPPDATALERLTYLIMPAIALGIPNSALITPLHPHQHVGCAAGGLRANRARQGPGDGDLDLQNVFRNARTSVVSGMLRRNYQRALLVISGVYVLINFGIDILYAALDPRVRY